LTVAILQLAPAHVHVEPLKIRVEAALQLDPHF
jgi:hypothetical protein